ncbi:MAG: pseudouridine synthase, partial [Chitinophagaceae bacterium]
MTKKSAKGFEKFMNKEPKGAAKKEMFRQEKRRMKADLREAGRIAREQKYLEQTGQAAPSLKSSTRHQFNKIQDDKKVAEKETPIPLNKFVAHAGICGRREAVEIIKKGEIIVNNEAITNPAHKVTDNDTVKYKGKRIFAIANAVYILLNKPKDYITTLDDPNGRKTVLDLIKGATPQRVYPVGRLDRNTTGVLLLTNDGELAQKLTHPSYQIKKIYEVGLDKVVSKKDIESLVTGLTLEDGFIQADAAAYVDMQDKSLVGIEIHSGRNRIVRRMFEHLGYKVTKLDRVLFANLTKKNVNRGKWRMLNEKEVRLLKYMNKSFVKKAKPT